MRFSRFFVITAAVALACSSTETLDQRIRNVNVAGTRVDGGVYGGAGFDLLVVPLDAHGASVLENGMSVQVSVTAPAGIAATVVDTQCVLQRERQPLAVGIVVDGSSSMERNDPDDASGPAPGRKATVHRIVDTMQPGDIGLLADFFGSTADPLRDLVCVASSPGTPPPCIATAASLTADTAALHAAAAVIQNHFGTPLYAACLQMEGILAPQADQRKALVVLSDGLPTDDVARASCLDAARSSNISIFTVGFGNDQGGTVALRDLAEATGGAYAQASDTAQLGRVLSNIAYSDGFCTIHVRLDGMEGVAPGTTITGEVTTGTRGARGTFEFLAPVR